MTRRIALVAEIFQRPNNTSAKEGCPLAIDCHAPNQRIMWANQPSGKRKPIVRCILRQRRKHGKHSGLDRFARLEKFTAPMDRG